MDPGDCYPAITPLVGKPRSPPWPGLLPFHDKKFTFRGVVVNSHDGMGFQVVGFSLFHHVVPQTDPKPRQWPPVRRGFFLSGAATKLKKAPAEASAPSVTGSGSYLPFRLALQNTLIV